MRVSAGNLKKNSTIMSKKKLLDEDILNEKALQNMAALVNKLKHATSGSDDHKSDIGGVCLNTS